jgi:hypothetical protein
MFAAGCAAFIPLGTAQASTHAPASAFARQAVSQRAADAPGGTRVTVVTEPESEKGCSDGAVCMYTDDNWNQGTPEHYWTTYGCSNLSNETGDRYVLNNQYGGDTATLWTGSDCKGTSTIIPEGTSWEGSITPINSISVDHDG